MRKRICRCIVCGLLFLTFIFSTGCGGATDPYCLLCDFAELYGTSATVYAPCVPEGKKGYCEEGFLETLFGEEVPPVSNFAFLLLPLPDAAGECGAFTAKGDTGAVIRFCEQRIALLRSMGAVSDVHAAETAFVTVRGNTVVYCAMPDAARAEKILRRLL